MLRQCYLTGILILLISVRRVMVMITFCDQYNLFCFFSDGVPKNITALKKSEKFCKRISSEANVLGVEDPVLWEEFRYFSKIYSIKNVITNVKITNGNWIWRRTRGKRIATDSEGVFSERNNVLIYESDATNPLEVYLVCVKECRATYRKYHGISLHNKTLEKLDNFKYISGNEKRCKRECETDRYCEGFEINVQNPGKCLLYLNKTIDTIKNPQAVYYAVDRSMKTVEKCIGITPVGKKFKRAATTKRKIKSGRLAPTLEKVASTTSEASTTSIAPNSTEESDSTPEPTAAETTPQPDVPESTPELASLEPTTHRKVTELTPEPEIYPDGIDGTASDEKKLTIKTTKYKIQILPEDPDELFPTHSSSSITHVDDEDEEDPSDVTDETTAIDLGDSSEFENDTFEKQPVASDQDILTTYPWIPYALAGALGLLVVVCCIALIRRRSGGEESESEEEED